jgi:uncharacterized protein YjbI with pentapeptide repeats
MANPEHLKILSRGIGIWNEWRKAHPEIKPDLHAAELDGRSLSGANFTSVDLRHASLTGAQLISSHLRDATLNNSHLRGANLSSAQLKGADFRGSDAQLINLRNAELQSVNFTNTRLSGAALNNANLFKTIFVGVNLSEVEGLKSVQHHGPSELSISTMYLSRGMLPKVFLRGCGLSDWQIEAARLDQPDIRNEELTDILYKIHDLRAHQAIQINPLFISYSHSDDPFVDAIENLLNEKGVRFWRDIHHTMAGRLETQIDRAIRLNPTVLLILSSHSVESDWVQHEARLARKLELETKRDVLCPIALDDTWKDCNWPERLREQIMEYNILDFSKWNNKDSFQQMFNRLIEGLDLFYK